MTLIKGMGLGIDEPPSKTSQQSKFDISIGLRTHNDINQGNGVRNRLTPPGNIGVFSNWISP